MDMGELKLALGAVKLPPDAGARIVRSCAAAAPERKPRMRMRRPAAMIAAAALCLCLAVAGAAAAGHFRDVKSWTGAVTGTVYEQADDEIAIRAAAGPEGIAVSVRFLSPGAFPYRELETIALRRYQILDSEGNVLLSGEGDQAAVRDGGAEIQLAPDGLAGGTYRLRIEGLTGGSKGDQPLPILGTWEAAFTF